MKQYFKQIRLLPLLLCLLCLERAAAQSYTEMGNFGSGTNNFGGANWGVGVSPKQLNVVGAYTGNNPASDNFYNASNSATGTPIEITGNIAPSFYDLVFNNGGTASVLVSNTVGIDVTSTLQLQSGILTTSFTDAAMAIRLGTTATTTGSSIFGSTRYVDGYMGKAGSTAFTYPLGNADIFSPATFSDPNGSTINYRVGTPGNTTTFATQPGLQLVSVSTQEFYNTSNINGTAQIGSSIKIPYNNFTGASYVTDPATLTIAGFNGTNWVNLSGVTTDQSGGNSNFVTVTLASALTTFTKFALASTSTLNPLPVVFTGFSGKNVNCLSMLKWSTSTEVNSSYYIVEASTDGMGFKEAARVVSNNSILGSFYTASLPAVNGTNFYRIKAVDIDGRAAYYSTIVTIKNTCPVNLKVNLYPNPTTYNVTLYGFSGKNTITVFNEAGQKMATVLNTTFVQLLPVSTYANGIYTISIVNMDGSIQNIKFIKK